MDQLTPINHPNPQFRRNNWKSLDGTWSFRFDDACEGEANRWYEKEWGDRKITVPFSYETEQSGIGEADVHQQVWYWKSVEITKKRGERVVIHFEGVDYDSTLWVNGQKAGCHQGGYTRFSFDITDLSQEGENSLALSVKDSLSREIPRGKQRWVSHNFGCWYTQTTGIWRSVWLEYRGETAIDDLIVVPDVAYNRVVLTVTTPPQKGLRVESLISYQGREVSRASHTVGRDGTVTFTQSVVDEEAPEGVHLWEPVRQFDSETFTFASLYDLELTLYREEREVDQVFSYFGMRSVSAEEGHFKVNNCPVYLKLLLDQGYWERSGITPPSEQALIDDILLTLQAGYNGVRKHQKCEDHRFLYWCDRLGVIVWSETPAAYHFSERAQQTFTHHWIDVVNQNRNHPSVLVWVPFNESWGIHEIGTRREIQSFVNGIYYLTKGIDPTRPVVTNDGWEHTLSDIVTIHDYSERVESLPQNPTYKVWSSHVGVHGRPLFVPGYEYKGQPIVVSEYGGIAYKSGDGWGYGDQAESEEALLLRLKEQTDTIKKCPGVVGYCYTQTSDVEQEVNGILTMSRRWKVDPAKLKAINES